MAPVRPLVLLAAGFVVGCGPAEYERHAERPAPPPVIERAFDAGGRVTMHLGAGGYTIEGSPDPVIRLAWETRDPAGARRVRAEVTTDGHDAHITTGGPSNGFTAVIRLPQRTDLKLMLSAGALRVGNIEGHKDVRVLAGNVAIGVGKPERYHAVDATVMAGDIDANPFGGHRGGLLRSVRWDGSGTYDLRVRLTAGDITLHE